MGTYFRIPAAGGGFFLSAWLLMVFWGILAPDLGLRTVSYVTAMLMTIALWLVVTPLVGTVARKRKR